MEVRYDLGSGPSVLVSSQAVTLGSWHMLVFRRYHQDGMLQIDKSDPVRGKASGRNKSLNIKGAMYVGGHPHMNRTGDLVGTYKGLQGCVRDLRIRRKSVGLVEGVEGVGVVSCSSHPCREGYCRNEGQCAAMEGRKKAVCSCIEQFRGKRCHKIKSNKYKVPNAKKNKRQTRITNHRHKTVKNKKRQRRNRK